jgi:ketosteroid isomerase-like protein
MNPFLCRTNRVMVRTFILAGLATLLASCAKKPEAVNVRDLNQQFISAWNSKDADKVIGFLAEDVHFLQGNLHLSGKSSVAQDWVRSTLPTIADLKTNVVSSAADTETAYEGGTYSVDVLPETPDEPHGLGEGNFLLLWKKTADGSWKLSYAQLEGLPVQARGR